MNGALTYPMDRDDWIKTVLIGGILSILGVLVIPLFVVYGYLIRAIRTTIAGEAEPPAFDDWGTLVVDGVKAWLVGIVYMIIPGIIAAITIGGSILAMATGDPIGTGAGLAGLFAGLALTAVLSLVFGYVAVAAIVHFAHERRLGAAFEFDQLRIVIFHRDYAIAWLISLLVLVAAGVVTVVPIVGWIATPFVTFYALVVAARLWAGGYVDALDIMESRTGVDVGHSTT